MRRAYSNSYNYSMADGPRSIWDAEVQDVIKHPEAGFPSPESWSDQVLYFLLPDRFSNNTENGYVSNTDSIVTNGTAPLFKATDRNTALFGSTDPEAWEYNGNRWCGGTLLALSSKLGYLKRLGVTAIWIGPVFKQIATDEHSYHGYGVQNFLEIDPRFGTKEQYKALVKTAHDMGLYIIQDIICNHVGDVFRYDGDPNPNWTWDDGKNEAKTYPVKGFYDGDHQDDDLLPFGPVNADKYPEAAIWPLEFQDGEKIFRRQGRINNWERTLEYLDGDFFVLKELDIGINDPDSFMPTPALKALVSCFKYWIAFADLDAFRLDTVKHMGFGPTRYFCNAIHEYAVSIGKDNFYIIGEITGNNESKFDTVTETGLNAALGVTDLQQMLWQLPKGGEDPQDYFNHFTNAPYLHTDTHAWLGSKLVTMLDDHDQVWRGDFKGRFCSDDLGPKLVFAALAFNFMTLGIPCIYYGTEQAFNGSGGSGLEGHGADQWIRECMFGGKFGAFASQGKHFFDESTVLYKEIGRLAALRTEHLALKRGRQYLRELSLDGQMWFYPSKIGQGRMESVVAWSRVFNGVEIVCAMNTDVEDVRTVWVTIDAEIHAKDDQLAALYEEQRSSSGSGTVVSVASFDQRAAVQIAVPPAGFVMFKK